MTDTLQVEEMTDEDLHAAIARLTEEAAARDQRREEKAAWLSDLAELISTGFVTADEIRAVLGDKPKRAPRKQKVEPTPDPVDGPQGGPVIETPAPGSKFPPNVTFTPSLHVLCTDLDNQYGTPLIPAMCRTTEVLMTTHNGAVKSCITKAYADEAGFRLKGTLIAAGSTNGGVQDSAHRVQCLTHTHCGNQLAGYCQQEYTCEKHVSAAQKAVDEANAPKEEVTDADIDAVLIRGPHVVNANQRILQAHATDAILAEVLKREYGEGGGSIQLADGQWGSSWHNAKGLRITTNSGVERLLKWTEVAERTAKLIDAGRIASSEVAKEEPAPDAPHRYTLSDKPKSGDMVHYVGPNDDTIGVFKSAHGESAPEVKGVSATTGNVVTSLVPDSAYYGNSLHPEWGVFAASRFPAAVSSEDGEVIASGETPAKGRMFPAEVAVFADRLKDTGSARWSEGTQPFYTATLADGVLTLLLAEGASSKRSVFDADRDAIEVALAGDAA